MLSLAEVLRVPPFDTDIGFVLYFPGLEIELCFRTYEHVQRQTLHGVLRRVFIGQERDGHFAFLHVIYRRVLGRRQLYEACLTDAVDLARDVRLQAEPPPLDALLTYLHRVVPTQLMVHALVAVLAVVMDVRVDLFVVYAAGVVQMALNPDL